MIAGDGRAAHAIFSREVCPLPSDPGPRFQLVATKSGALALEDTAAAEVMHPGLGPAAEARVLHVEGAGLAERLLRPDPAPLVVFDVGLGAGSNAGAALSCHQAARTAAAARGAPVRDLSLISFESDLGAFAFAVEQPGVFGLPEAAARRLLATGSHEEPGAGWRLVHGDALARLGGEGPAEVIFWDPFSQAANPRLWTIAAFTAARAAAAPDAVLTTYSSSTTARTAMLLAGWFVGEGPEPAGGRRTTLAAAAAGLLAAPLFASWVARRVRSTAPWPDDAPADALARHCAHPQLAGAHASLAGMRREPGSATRRRRRRR